MKLTMAEATQLRYMARYPKNPISIELLDQLGPNAFLIGVLLITENNSGIPEIDENLDFLRKNS